MSNDEYGVFFGDTLYDYTDEKIPIIEHLFYENDIICISSKPGIGKSILAKQLMCCMTTGKPFLDTYKVPKKRTVLYVQTEGDRAETIERMTHMTMGMDLDNNRWAHINQDGIVINTQEGIKNLIKLAKEPNMDFDIIILDPLYTTVKGTLSSDEVATDWIRNARKLKTIFNCSIMVLHHDSKEGFFEGKNVEKQDSDIFGSVYWSAFFNSNFKLKRRKDQFVLQRGKQRSGKITDSVLMKLVEPKPLMFVNNDNDLDLTSLKVTMVLKSGERFQAKEIQLKADVSLASVYRTLGKLKDAGMVENTVEDKISYFKWN